MFKPKQIENILLFLYILSLENTSIIIKNNLERLVQIKKEALLGQLYKFNSKYSLIIYIFLSNYNTNLKDLTK